MITLAEYCRGYELRHAIGQEFILAASEEGNPRIIFKQGNTIVANIEGADRIYIITQIKSAMDAGRIVLSFVPNQRRPDLQPWEMQKAIVESDYSSEYYLDLGDKPKDMLWRFAFWNTITEDLKVLKNQIALQENWSFIENPSDDEFSILTNYIKYTFSKLWLEKQFFVGIDGRYSVMNTGLVNKNYQYIYILFEKNVGIKPWKFSMFCIPGVKQGGRILADNFKVLPKPAHYFKDISDISYIIEYDKSLDEQLPDLQPDHYFIDHPERLPLPFLLDGCRKNQDIVNMLNTNIDDLTHEEKIRHWRTIGTMIEGDSAVYDDLETAFRAAVRKAIMRVSWNYRTAIPVYFPTDNAMSILLPLSFGSDTIAEVALVVERNSVSQRYTAPTILSLTMAYSNARLVCKPESDWLNQRIFEAARSKLRPIEDE